MNEAAISHLEKVIIMRVLQTQIRATDHQYDGPFAKEYGRLKKLFWAMWRSDSIYLEFICFYFSTAEAFYYRQATFIGKKEADVWLAGNGWVIGLLFALVSVGSMVGALTPSYRKSRAYIAILVISAMLWVFETCNISSMVTNGVLEEATIVANYCITIVAIFSAFRNIVKFRGRKCLRKK